MHSFDYGGEIQFDKAPQPKQRRLEIGTAHRTCTDCDWLEWFLSTPIVDNKQNHGGSEFSGEYMYWSLPDIDSWWPPLIMILN